MAFDAGRVEFGVGARLDKASLKRVDAAVKDYERKRADVTVGFKLDRRQLDRGYQLLKKWRAEKAEAKLGFAIQKGQYDRHLAMVRTAGRRSANAKLGFKIDRSSLATFERQIKAAIRRVERDLEVHVNFKADRDTDRVARAISNVGDESEDTSRQLHLLERSAGFVTRRFSGMGTALSKLSLSFGPLSGRLAYLGRAIAVIAPLVASLAGALTALGSSFASAVAGAGAFATGIAGVLGPTLGLLIGVVTRLGNVMDAYKARQQAADAANLAADDTQKKLADSANTLANAQESLSDAHDGVRDAVKGADRANRAYRQAVRDAREEIKQAARDEQDAARAVVDAQREVAQARRDAANAAREANAEARRATLDVSDATLGLEEARDTQGQAFADLQAAAPGSEEARDALQAYQRAQNNVRRAELDLADARRRQRDAQKEQISLAKDGTRAYQPLIDATQRLREAQRALADSQREHNELLRLGVQRNPQVVSAAEALADANEGVAQALRNVGRAQRNLDTARRGQSAAGDPVTGVERAALLTGKLTEAEQKFLKTMERVVDVFKKQMQPATDAVFGGMTRALERVVPLVRNLRDDFEKLGEVVGNQIDRAAKQFTGKDWTAFFSEMLALSREAGPALTTMFLALADMFKEVARAAGPIVVEVFDAMARAMKNTADAMEDDPDRVQKVVKTLIGDFLLWVDLLRETFDLLVTVFSIGRGEGNSSIKTLTDNISDLNDELQTKEGREDFLDWLRDSKEFLKDMWELLRPTVQGLRDFARFAQQSVDALGGIFGADNASRSFFRAFGFLVGGTAFAKLSGLAGPLKKIGTWIFQRIFVQSVAAERASHAVSYAVDAMGAHLRGLTQKLKNVFGRVLGRAGTAGGAAAAESAAGAIAGEGAGAGIGGALGSRGGKLRERFRGLGNRWGKWAGRGFIIGMAAAIVLMGPDIAKALKKIFDRIHISFKMGVHGPRLSVDFDDPEDFARDNDAEVIPPDIAAGPGEGPRNPIGGGGRSRRRRRRRSRRPQTGSFASASSFGDIDVDADATRQNVDEGFRRMGEAVDKHLGDTERRSRRRSRRIRRDLEDDFDGVRKSVSRSMERTSKNAGDSMERIRNKGSRETQRLTRNVGQNMSEFERVVFRGMSYVAEATNSALRAFDEKPISLNVPRPRALRRAVGGWIGQRGQRGPDERLAMLGDGEAVLNGPQQGPVEAALAATQAMGIQPYGSLDDVFRGMNVRHYARGGFTDRVRIPGTSHMIQRGILKDVVGMMRAYRMMITAGWEGGHDPQGEHPIGLAIDAVPGMGGNWGLLDRSARDAGYPNPPNRPFRWIGWRNEANHGPPPEPNAHIHYSWLAGQSGFRSAGSDIPRLRVRGTAGSMKRLAQAAISRVRNAGNRFIDRRAGASLGGKMGKFPQVGGGGKLSAGQVKALWIGAGGDPAVADLMVKVAFCESGFDPGATGPRTSYGFNAIGLWQIHPPPPDAADPRRNAVYAVGKYNADRAAGGSGLGPWVASQHCWGSALQGFTRGKPKVKKGAKTPWWLRDLPRQLQVSDVVSGAPISVGGATIPDIMGNLRDRVRDNQGILGSSTAAATKLGDSYFGIQAYYDRSEEDFVKTPDDPDYDPKKAPDYDPATGLASAPYQDEAALKKRERELKHLKRIKKRQQSHLVKAIRAIGRIVRLYRGAGARIKGFKGPKYKKAREKALKEINGAIPGWLGRIRDTRADRADAFSDLLDLNDLLGELRPGAAEELNQLIEGGDTADDSANREAILAQAQERARVLGEAVRLSAGAFNVFSSSGDIGSGAQYALRAAAYPGGTPEGTGGGLPFRMDPVTGRVTGPGGVDFTDVLTNAPGRGVAPVININTLHPGDSRTLDAVSRAANRGNVSRGYVSSPRENIGL